ncbi:GntR family transcriptional regulator [Actinomadura rugatobispora]|uniref:GntR family transcriptional regulator n=1 Tax=Actinomadura rugatobispora TaxID=1994 RepID=A0ABW0ZRU3_9ACTN
MQQRRLVRTKTRAVVVDYVLEELFEGRLKSGDRIDLDEVCEALGVSRLPVREAIVMLERDGIVSTKYHRGVYVEPFDAESIMDDFEIMGVLSGIAVRRLAEKQDTETIAALQGLVEELRSADPEDRDRVFELVQQIITLEQRAGGSRRLRAELRSYHGYLPQAFRVGAGRSHARTVEAHDLVVRAIVAGDGEEAARHRLEDFRDAGRRVVAELERRGVLSGA